MRRILSSAAMPGIAEKAAHSDAVLRGAAAVHERIFGHRNVRLLSDFDEGQIVQPRVFDVCGQVVNCI